MLSYKFKRVKSIKESKETELFVFNALKPGGFDESIIPIPNLKDKLAWYSWANIRRPEQPTFIAILKNKIVAVVLGEPVEMTFDKGESEISDFIIQPEHNTIQVINVMLEKLLKFYKQNFAKQIHFWVLEDDFNKGKYDLWQKVLIEDYGFGFKGFRRISKWSGKPIVKIEKVL